MTLANDKQIGGNHYKKNAIQPWDYIIANKLGYLDGTAIKYITRWRDKGGIADIDKAIHFLEKLKETYYAEEEAAKIMKDNGWDAKQEPLTGPEYIRDEDGHIIRYVPRSK